MNSIATWVIFISLNLVLASCESLWNAGNRGGLKNDLTELINRKQQASVDLTCQMLGTTRTGMCKGVIPFNIVENIVSTLHLLEVTNDQPPDYDYESWISDGPCDPKQTSGIRRFKSKRRATELQLQNGSSFEYLILFFEPSSNKTCIQVSYAYG